jgi:hypothetical protein
MAHVNANPPSLREAAPSAPPFLIAAAYQAMAKDPSARPPPRPRSPLWSSPRPPGPPPPTHSGSPPTPPVCSPCQLPPASPSPVPGPSAFPALSPARTRRCRLRRFAPDPGLARGGGAGCWSLCCWPVPFWPRSPPSPVGFRWYGSGWTARWPFWSPAAPPHPTALLSNRPPPTRRPTQVPSPPTTRARRRPATPGPKTTGAPAAAAAVTGMTTRAAPAGPAATPVEEAQAGRVETTPPEVDSLPGSPPWPPASSPRRRRASLRTRSRCSPCMGTADGVLPR